MTLEVTYLSNDYANRNTNSTTLMTLTLTLTDPHEAFERFVRRYYCDFVWSYCCTIDGAIVTLLFIVAV